MRWFRNLEIKKNPDGTDAFVRSAPTNNGTISPSKQDSPNLTIPYKQVKGNEKRETNAKPIDTYQVKPIIDMYVDCIFQRK